MNLSTLQRLLKEATKKDWDVSFAEFLDGTEKILAKIKGITKMTGNEPSGYVEPLSEKDIEILRCFPEIASSYKVLLQYANDMREALEEIKPEVKPIFYCNCKNRKAVLSESQNYEICGVCGVPCTDSITRIDPIMASIIAQEVLDKYPLE